MYFVFFVIVGAAAYGLITTTSAPTVALDGPAYSQGDNVTLNDRTFTVTSVGRTGGGGGGGGEMAGELTWVNESARQTATLENGSEIPPTDVVWEDQEARTEQTFENGSTIQFNGSEYSVAIANESATLHNTTGSDNVTVEPDDTLQYQGFEATVTSVDENSLTLVWGNAYLVTIDNSTDPPQATLVEQRNATALATQDPALYDQTVTIDGVEHVTFRENDTSVPVDQYFGDVETHTLEPGDSLQYQGVDTTVDSINEQAVTLAWTGPTENTIDLSEGGNFTVQGEQYFAHFPDNSSVQLLSVEGNYEAYHQQEEQIQAYHERMNGFWGILLLSFSAAVILLATAYLPVRG